MDDKKMMEIERSKINLQVALARRQNWVAESFSYLVIVVAILLSMSSLFSDYTNRVYALTLTAVIFVLFYLTVVIRTEKKCDAQVESAYSELAKIIDSEILNAEPEKKAKG